VSELVQCARALVGAGYTHAFCTPHVWPHVKISAASIQIGTNHLAAEFTRAGVPLRLFPGGEMNLVELWPDLKDQPIITYGLAGKYALFDFWAESIAECADRLFPGIEHLQSRGIQPILAHPERIAALHRDPCAIDRITETGVLLQLNGWCLNLALDNPISITAHRLLREGRYFLIGSDLHQPAGMPDRIAALTTAEKIIGKDALDKLTIENPRLLLPPAFTT